jgi:flagellar biosynthesis/type III secretory pathway protein FliH
MTAFLLPPSGVAKGTGMASPIPQGFAPRSRLLKADDVAARNAAAAREAAEVAQRESRRSLEEAYQAGVAAGRAAAEDEGVAAAARGAAALQQLATETARLSAEAVDTADTAVLGAVLDLTGWLLRAEPSQASRSLLERLSVAARTLTPGPRTVVRCSTEDLEAVQGWARSGVEVVADARLAPGEARLDRGNGSAVLTYSAALKRAAEALGLPPATADGNPTNGPIVVGPGER